MAKLLTIEEAANLKGVARGTLYTAVAENRIKSERQYNRILLREADVLAWVPVKRKERPGASGRGGRPKGTPMTEEQKARIAEGQARRWQKRREQSASASV